MPFFSLNKHQQQLSYCSCSHTVYVLCLSAPCVGINLIMNFIIDWSNQYSIFYHLIIKSPQSPLKAHSESFCETNNGLWEALSKKHREQKQVFRIFWSKINQNFHQKGWFLVNWLITSGQFETFNRNFYVLSDCQLLSYLQGVTTARLIFTSDATPKRCASPCGITPWIFCLAG